jgi:hypothetical protein
MISPADSPGMGDPNKDTTMARWNLNTPIYPPGACIIKNIMFINDDSSIISKFGASLTDDTG